MEQSLRSHGQGRPDQGSSPSSDRLRKAIERNRAKRSKKGPPGNDPVMVTPPPSRPAQGVSPPQRQGRSSNVRGGPPRSRRFAQMPQETEEDFDEEEIDEIDEEDEEEYVQAPLPQRRRSPPQGTNRFEGRAARQPQPAQARSNRPPRRGVGEQQPAQPRSSAPPRRNPPQAPPQRRQSTPPPRSRPSSVGVRKKRPAFVEKALERIGVWLGPKEKWIERFQKLSWLGCFLLFFHLIFSDRGVADYYSQKKSLDKKVKGLAILQEEKKELKTNIGLIRKNKAHQKKLVRDHLGFISKDEFLILFQKGKTEI